MQLSKPKKAVEEMTLIIGLWLVIFICSGILILIFPICYGDLSLILCSLLFSIALLIVIFKAVHRIYNTPTLLFYDDFFEAIYPFTGKVKTIRQSDVVVWSKKELKRKEHHAYFLIHLNLSNGENFNLNTGYYYSNTVENELLKYTSRLTAQVNFPWVEEVKRLWLAILVGVVSILLGLVSFLIPYSNITEKDLVTITAPIAHIEIEHTKATTGRHRRRASDRLIIALSGENADLTFYKLDSYITKAEMDTLLKSYSIDTVISIQVLKADFEQARSMTQPSNLYEILAAPSKSLDIVAIQNCANEKLHLATYDSVAEENYIFGRNVFIVIGLGILAFIYFVYLKEYF